MNLGGLGVVYQSLLPFFSRPSRAVLLWFWLDSSCIIVSLGLTSTTLYPTGRVLVTECVFLAGLCALISEFTGYFLLLIMGGVAYMMTGVPEGVRVSGRATVAFRLTCRGRGRAMAYAGHEWGL